MDATSKIPETASRKDPGPQYFAIDHFMFASRRYYELLLDIFLNFHFGTYIIIERYPINIHLSK
jgi:hypothetical protein